MPWYLYLVRCADGSLYTGITPNVKKRISRHNAGQGAKSIVKSKRPVTLEYVEKFVSRSLATQREQEIKGCGRKKKLSLIQGNYKKGLP